MHFYLNQDLEILLKQMMGTMKHQWTEWPEFIPNTGKFVMSQEYKVEAKVKTANTIEEKDKKAIN